MSFQHTLTDTGIHPRTYLGQSVVRMCIQGEPNLHGVCVGIVRSSASLWLDRG